jgi:SAM-dependent methyltransferase
MVLKSIEIPYSQACENNKDPILAELKKLSCFEDTKNPRVLEIGHGTGQHALYFASQLTCQWHPADTAENNWMLEARPADSLPTNLHPPFEFHAHEDSVATNIEGNYDLIFSANTLHIMSLAEASSTLKDLARYTRDGTSIVFYGPFRFQGQFTSASNARFDQSLKHRHPQMGIRDFEWIQQELLANHIHFCRKVDLPANNNLLVFQYKKS